MNTTKRICEYCGKEFEISDRSYNGKKYCSIKCSEESKKNTPLNIVRKKAITRRLLTLE